MEKAIAPVTQDVFNQINNRVYDSAGDIWWQQDTVLHLLHSSVNPARVGYFKRVLFETLGISSAGKKAVEVGCGGGILCEEIAHMGFDTTGMDPSEQSLETARNHAKASGLNIHYEKGSGEQLPYADASFDVLFCCDVLEHVRDLPRVVSEFSRVLKPGGILCYDTLNRTFVSWLVAIKIWQEWKRYAFMPPNLHVWRMFIKPSEITALLLQHGFDPREQRGTEPNVPIPKMLTYCRKRASGEWTFAQLGAAFQLVESNDMKILYMGYAVKKK